MTRRIIRHVVVLSLATGLFGCRAWHTQPSVTQGVADHPDRLRVTIEGEEVRILEGLRIEGDSLIGFEFQKNGASRRVVLPVSGVARVERRELDNTRTFLFSFVYAVSGVAALLGDR